MANGRTLIMAPTFRVDEVAYRNLEEAARLGGDFVDVVISDNSCRSDKWDFLNALQSRNRNCTLYLNEENIGANANWMFVLGLAESYDYACMIADDDLFSSDYVLAGIEKLREDPTCAAASGLIMCVTASVDNAVSKIGRSIVASKAAERIEYFSGFNAPVYSVFRPVAIKRFVAFMRDRPFRASYLDQIMTYTLLCHGSYHVDCRRNIYLYFNENWRDEVASFDASSRFYIEAGLPANFSLLHDLAWAIDAAHYFCSKYRPACLSSSEARDIAALLFARNAQRFRDAFEADEAPFETFFREHRAPLSAMRAFLDEPGTITNAVDLLGMILTSFDRSIGTAYETFAQSSLVEAHCRLRFDFEDAFLPSVEETKSRTSWLKPIGRRVRQELKK